MDSNNWREERRMEREKWREERRRFREEIRDRYHFRHSGGGRVWMGVFLLIIGVVAFLKVALFPIPAYVFTWQMLLIALGFFMGIRHNFRGAAWFILMMIGGIFLIKEFFPDFILYQFLWPAALILLGLFFIFKPRRRNWHWREYDEEDKGKPHISTSAAEETVSDDEILDSTSVFGGSKKKVLSKNFKFGDIVNIFGGTEIDMSQADINGEAKLDLTQIFGGTKLIIPANWKLIVKNAAILGGVEDKRPNQPFDPNKVLILTGTSIFGGIEIRSY